MKTRIILTAVCLIALTGYFLPAISVEVSFMGRSTSNTFSLTSFFNRPDNQLSGLDLPQTDLFGSDETSLFAGAGARLMTSIASYLAALVLLIALTVCTALGKLRKTSIALSAVSIGLLAYAGHAISTVTGPIIEALSETLGFLAIFIDLSNLITISPGAGYWLTLTALGAVFILRILFVWRTVGGGERA
jgi:hypothetical protein